MRLTLLFVLATILSVGKAHSQAGHYYASDRFSSGLINAICQDSYGFIWIATDYGLNKFDGYTFTTYRHLSNDTTSLCSNSVVSLHCDQKGQLWVGTSKGLDRYDYGEDLFQHIYYHKDLHPRVMKIQPWDGDTLLVSTAGYGLFCLTGKKMQRLNSRFTSDEENGHFGSIFRDSYRRIWKCGTGSVITVKDRSGHITVLHSHSGNVIEVIERLGEPIIVCQKGLLKYADGKLSEYGIDLSQCGTDIVINQIFKDNNEDIYIGTRGDGLFLLKKGSNKLERVECFTRDFNLNTAKVCAIAKDRQGNLWVGCQPKGLVMIPSVQPQFHSWSFAAQGISLHSTITSICEGSNGELWCTVQGNGIYGFNSRGNVVAKAKGPMGAEFIFRDSQKRYWVGTSDGLYEYEPTTGQTSRRVTFDCDKFNDMTDDGNGNIYISTFSKGFCVFNTSTGQLRNFNSSQKDSVRGWLCNNWVMAMMPDHNGNIWLATSSGVSCYNPKADSFRSQGWHQLINGVMCYSLCETKQGDVLIGTDQGIYIYKQGEKDAELFPSGEELCDKVVCYIVQANNGDIWCSTSAGLWQYDSRKGKFIGHFNGNGLITKEYINCVGLHTDNDNIFFATNDGITSFSPSDIKPGHGSLPEIKLTDFLIAGNSANIRTESHGQVVMQGPVIDNTRFSVSYLDNSITLKFSLLDYSNPSNIIYEYRIGGGAWTQNPEGQNAIMVSHLQPGKYRIEVRALLSGTYSPVKVITIEVAPPWYQSTLARIIYALLGISFLLFLGWAYRRRARQQMNEEKMKFLINATHDIRSPLTLIMSPLANLRRRLSQGATMEDALRDVDTIERNAKRILTLVNQILDVRKIDKQQMHLHCSKTDLIAFARGVFKMYEYNAKEHNITFQLQAEGLSRLDVWIDRSQFDKVISNLLSNAFKYSSEGGIITVAIAQDGEWARLKVTDNGTGMENDALKHIFDRFYQGDNSRRMNVKGTGIGLNLCKMIVDMHHGTITAENRTDGHGAVFTVSLPLGNAHLKPEEIEEHPTETAETKTVIPTQSSSRRRVLIVDDDEEIRQYISSELSHYYKFSACSNGKEGLKELLTNDYDLVVSDVMMPEMDGFTMLRMIKTNINISHIPVIMLTSKADVGNRLEGLERGADAFLAKPFNMEELHATIENLIQTRLRLKGKFTGAQLQADKVEQIEVKGNDEQLMERIMKAINKYMSDSDFNVEMLCQEVGISRAQLHRKMKEMTGLSTSEFIRNIRLEQGARLLKEQKVNITQVAYLVGFSNLAHFSTVFRKHFGVTPTEYAEKADKA